VLNPAQVCSCLDEKEILDRYMDLGKATLFEGTKKIKENKLKVLVVWLLWMWLALCRHVAPGCWGRARRP